MYAMGLTENKGRFFITNDLFTHSFWHTSYIVMSLAPDDLMGMYSYYFPRMYKSIDFSYHGI